MPLEKSSDLETLLRSPASASDNKYSRGVVGFVTGSSRYPGAALLGIEAAYELGIGMACYLGPREVSNLVLVNRPETILGLEKAQVLVLGSGVADDELGPQRENIINAGSLGVPLVIDAGALQIVDFGNLTTPAILTPHLGEAKKLLSRLSAGSSESEFENNPDELAKKLADLTGQLVLLKGSTSHLALSGHQSLESGPGSVHLATAGTGDVLAGMIGALASKYVAHKKPLTPSTLREIAMVALKLHSRAAELAAAQGEFGASAVCAAISDAAL